MYSKITNKLNYARETNPLYNNFNDDEVLTLTYDRYYKDKIGFEDYKKQMLEPMDFLQQNKMALKVYNERKNITQQDIKDYKLMLEKEALEEKGEIGFVEGLSEGITKNYGLGLVPFLGSLLEGYQNDRLNEINLKASKGIKLTDEEQELFNEEIKDFKEKSIRGYSVGGQIGAGIVPSFRFMGEYWATSKLFGGNPVLMALNPTAIYNEYQARQLEGDLLITDKGEVFLNDLQQKPVLKTLLKSYGSMFVSNFTEQLGGKIISPVLNKITPIFDNAAKKVFGENTINAVRKVGFDGFIEETFEEYIEKPLSFALGITDEEYTLENFLKSFEMSLDEFLVITGSVAIQGGISYSGAKLIEKLKGSGLNQKQINNILKNTTELEKESFLKRLEDIENINEEKIFNEYLDNLGKQIVDSGLSEKDAENEKKLLNTIMTNRAVREGKSRIDILNNYRLEEVRRGENDVKNISKNDVENDIETFYQKNTEVKESIEDVIKNYKENKNYKANIGKLQDWQIKELNKNGINVNENTEHRITTNFLKHINNRHGKDTETQKNQIPITEKDIEIIPYVINNPDYIEIGANTNRGLQAIKYVKNISKGITYYVEEVLNNENILESKTIYRKRTGGDTISKSENYRNILKTPNPYVQDGSSKTIIPNPNKNVKGKNETLQQETKGQIDLGQEGAIITLFEKADHSTLIHETGHYFLRFIEMMANNGSNISIKELETIRKFLGNNGESFTIRQQEKFARTFEQYVRRGIAPSNDLKLVFEDYKEWLTDIYKTSRELKANINKDIIDFFDGFIMGGDLDERLPRYARNDRERDRNDRDGKHNDNNDIYYQSINNDLELNQEVDILDISNSIKGKITKDKIKQKIQELIDKKEPIKTLSEPWMVEILNKKKNHIIHSSKTFDGSNKLTQHNKQLLNIDDLIKNSVLVETVDNIKKDKKPDVDKYLYFYTPIKDNDNIYLVKLFTEKGKNNKENIVNLYDVLTVKELSVRHLGDKTPLSPVQDGGITNSSTISIKQILQNVKDFYGDNALDSYVKENIENTTLYQDIANNNNINTSEEVYNKNIDIQINNNNRINKVKDYINNKKEMIGSTLEGTFMLSEDIIRRIGGEELLSFIKRYEARKMIKSNEYNNKLIGFYENMKYLKKNNINDYYTYDLALKNSDLNKIIELSEKYEDINLYENYLQLRDVLDEFHELELSVGIDVGFIENYIPRQIKDLDGLLSTLRNENIEDFNRIQKDLETAEKEGQILTGEDKIRVVNNFMAGFRSPIYAKTGGGNNITKERKIKQLNEKSNPFYETTEKAVANYIARNYDTILQRQFFGRLNKDQGDLFKKLRNKYRQLKKLKETDSHNIKKNEIIKLETKKKVQEITLNNLNKIKNKTKEQEDIIDKLKKQIKYLDSSINFYNKIKADTVKNMRNREIEKEISELRDKLDIDNVLENSIANYVNSIDHINSKDATLLKNTILYVLNPATTSGFSSFISNSSYGIALTGFINTIRQFKDLATTFYKNGFFNTINSGKNVDVKDLGLDGNLNDMLGSKGIINRIFKITLFEKVDLFAKSTFLNSAFKKTKKLLLNNDINTIRDIELIFGKDAEQVKEDIKNNNITLDVKSYLLIKLSETQPIFMSSRALGYLKNGNTRFFYSLKTFTLKQLSLYKKDVYDKIVKGKTNNERIEGLKNLITLQFYTMLVGLPVDLLTSFDDDDWLEPEMIKDSVLDNMLYLNIINRYVIDRAKTNLGTATFDFILGVPLTGLFNGLSRDIYKIQKGDFELEKSGLLRSISPSRDVLKVLEMGEK